LEVAFLVVMCIALKLLPAPLPLCGAWLAARASVASGAYSHTTEQPSQQSKLSYVHR